jgi:hypothetical protein
MKITKLRSGRFHQKGGPLASIDDGRRSFLGLITGAAATAYAGIPLGAAKAEDTDAILIAACDDYFAASKAAEWSNNLPTNLLNDADWHALDVRNEGLVGRMCRSIDIAGQIPATTSAGRCAKARLIQDVIPKHGEKFEMHSDSPETKLVLSFAQDVLAESRLR